MGRDIRERRRSGFSKGKQREELEERHHGEYREKNTLGSPFPSPEKSRMRQFRNGSKGLGQGVKGESPRDQKIARKQLDRKVEKAVRGRK